MSEHLQGTSENGDRPVDLELDAVRVSYGGIAAVKGVSLSVRRGEIVALIGANGAGKTSVLKAKKETNRSE